MIKTKEIQRLEEIVNRHNQQQYSERDSWLAMNLDDQETVLNNTVSSELDKGRQVFAQIVPEWAICSIDTMEADVYEWCEDCLADPYYADTEKNKPDDIFKADWQIIFVEHNWENGVETIVHDLKELV